MRSAQKNFKHPELFGLGPNFIAAAWRETLAANNSHSVLIQWYLLAVWFKAQLVKPNFTIPKQFGCYFAWAKKRPPCWFLHTSQIQGIVQPLDWRSQRLCKGYMAEIAGLMGFNCWRTTLKWLNSSFKVLISNLIALLCLFWLNLQNKIHFNLVFVSNIFTPCMTYTPYSQHRII